MGCRVAHHALAHLSPRTHTIAQGSPHNAPLAVGATTNGTVTINEDGGIFNAAVRPTANWSSTARSRCSTPTTHSPRWVRGRPSTTECTPCTGQSPGRRSRAPINDLERHNNTNNNQAAVAAGDDPTRARSIMSITAGLRAWARCCRRMSTTGSISTTPTAMCMRRPTSATTTAPEPSTVGCRALPRQQQRRAECMPRRIHQGVDDPACGLVCQGLHGCSHAVRIGGSQPVAGQAIHSNIGYRISSVNGNQFFNDARAVNGSLVSDVSVALCECCMDGPSRMIWKAEYNFYGYGEGGPSGPQYCSTSTSLTSAVVPCTSLYQAGESDGSDRIARRSDRAAELSREQRDPWSALRVLIAWGTSASVAKIP
jgi:hypothetical protein